MAFRSSSLVTFHLKLLMYWILIMKSDTVPIDNELTANPSIACGSDSVVLTFNTKNPFHGNVYVKGRFNETHCKVNGDAKQALSISIALAGPCGVRRRRSVTPTNGISVDVTVVVMFHPAVLTKVDKAFNVQCFYSQTEKTVSADLDVSMLTTSTITETIPMPACQYQVLVDGPHGTPIRYAQIGQAVYHKWHCTGSDHADNTFCMTVHTCTVDDGQGTAVLLLDDIGCAQDRYLLQNLDYWADNIAGQESHVFKFADKTHVFFSCQIRITVKEGDSCSRPQCPLPSRGKRSAPTGTDADKRYNDSSRQIGQANRNNTRRRLLADFDVPASKMIVLDIEDTENNASIDEDVFQLREIARVFCFDPLIIGLLGIVIFTLIASFLATTLAWYKAHRRKGVPVLKF